MRQRVVAGFWIPVVVEIKLKSHEKELTWQGCRIPGGQGAPPPKFWHTSLLFKTGGGADYAHHFTRGCPIIIWTGLNIKIGMVQKVYE